MPSRTIANEPLDAAFADLEQVHQHRMQREEPDGLVEKVYRQVVDGVCGRKWTAGERIIEAKLARELGISHVPVREAMERLRQEGWVERIPNRGVFVTQFDLEARLGLFQIREMLEAEAVRTLASTITEEQLAELKNVVELYISAQEADNQALVRTADTHFHRLLIHFLGNRRLDDMFESILLQARGSFFMISTNMPFYTSMIHERVKRADHLQIYEALEAQDAQLAVKTLRAHIRMGRITATKLWELVNDICRDDVHAQDMEA